MTAFGQWRRDLDRRLKSFLLARNPQAAQEEPERPAPIIGGSAALSADDYAWLGRLDAAFLDNND